MFTNIHLFFFEESLGLLFCIGVDLSMYLIGHVHMSHLEVKLEKTRSIAIVGLNLSPINAIHFRCCNATHMSLDIIAQIIGKPEGMNRMKLHNSGLEASKQDLVPNLRAGYICVLKQSLEPKVSHWRCLR